ncbi:MAG TPA: hypothetical protein VLA24_00930, partial [Pseudomonadales bacterium]|nr:hypothetical protein [Pseudomonadales bacterium]
KSLDAKAEHSGSTVASADAAAAGSKVAVGAALALNFVNDITTATTSRNITATEGGIGFSALSYANSSATANASASGAKASTDGGKDDNAESQVNKQLEVDDSKNSQANKDGVAGKAKTSEGNVSIAAGLALNLVNSKANASLSDGLVINAAGQFKLASTNETDAAAIASGEAVGNNPDVPPAKIGVGVGLALNIVNTENKASIGAATVTAKGIDLSAKMADPALGGDGFSNFKAEATAGAGATNVGLAGAVALNLVGTNSSTAAIAANATIDAGTGDVSITAINNTKSSTIAKAVVPANPDAANAKVGVGVAFALDKITNVADASIGDNVNLTNAGNVTLLAQSNNSSDTKVTTGAAGDLSVSPSVALNIVSNDTLASIGKGGLLT